MLVKFYKNSCKTSDQIMYSIANRGNIFAHVCKAIYYF